MPRQFFLSSVVSQFLGLLSIYHLMSQDIVKSHQISIVANLLTSPHTAKNEMLGQLGISISTRVGKYGICIGII
jgi:hypothetical protein